MLSIEWGIGNISGNGRTNTEYIPSLMRSLRTHPSEQIFGKTQEQAEAIMQKIHNSGSGVVGSYVHEVAEQKGIETTLLARQENFPLQIKVKKQ